MTTAIAGDPIYRNRRFPSETGGGIFLGPVVLLTGWAAGEFRDLRTIHVNKLSRGSDSKVFKLGSASGGCHSARCISFDSRRLRC